MPQDVNWLVTGGRAYLAQPQAEGRDRVWNNTVGFGALPKDEKPVNGYTDIQYRSFQSGQTLFRTPVGGTQTIYDYGPNYYDTNGYWTSSLDTLFEYRFGTLDSARNSLVNAAIVKALVKMADAKVNVAVAFAEASKTSDLIFDTARRVDRAYRAFRKGDLRGIAQNLNITPKRLHKSWLEYKYGWMPLLMDVKGAAEFFAQQHVGRPARFTVTASESRLYTDNWSQSFTPYGGGSPAERRWFQSSNIDAKVKIWCELSSPHYAAMQQIGLTNPLLIAWELVPFSFVFDWFIQVGDWLTAMTAQQGVVVRRKMVSIRDSAGFTRTEPTTVTSDLSYVYTMAAWNGGASRRYYSRSVPDLSPFSLYPPMTNSFGFPKLVTSLALIQGTYRGSSRTARI